MEAEIPSLKMEGPIYVSSKVLEFEIHIFSADFKIMASYLVKVLLQDPAQELSLDFSEAMRIKGYKKILTTLSGESFELSEWEFFRQKDESIQEVTEKINKLAALYFLKFRVLVLNVTENLSISN